MFIVLYGEICDNLLEFIFPRSYTEYSLSFIFSFDSHPIKLVRMGLPGHLIRDLEIKVWGPSWYDKPQRNENIDILEL